MLLWIFACIAIALCSILVLMRTCLMIITVSQRSMSPALEPGDRVLVLRKRLVSRLHKEQIVILKRPDVPDPSLYIKRIVALGGETFEDERIDGYIESGIPELRSRRYTWRLPPDSIFVRGDNQDRSLDSRSWGPLPVQCVQGVVLCTLRRNSTRG